MTSLAQALSAALLHFVWQGALVGVLLWIALLILRNRPAAIRYTVACAALAVLAILPAVTTWILLETPEAISTDPGILISAVAGVVPAAGAEARPWLRSLQPWALPVWSFGVLLLSFRLLLGSLQVYRLRRHGQPADSVVIAAVGDIARRMGLVRPLRVLISSLADGPTVVGWLRPVILLPAASVLGLTTRQLEAVLAHELAHIRRCDYLVNLLQMSVETLLFYHPAVWWTSSRIRHERELCCDDLAVASCGDPICYARALTRLERLRIATPAMALGSTGGPLAYRIQRLAGAGTAGYGTSKLPGLLALVIGLACFGLNIHWAQGQEKSIVISDQPPLISQSDEDLVKMKLNLERKLEEEKRARGNGTPAEGAAYTFVRTAKGNIQVDTAGAAILHRSGVEYPHAAVEKRIEGTVVVEATLDETGNVDDARVLSGPAELRKAALQSVLQWHFVSAAAGGTRVVKIDFKLPAPGENIAVAYKPVADSADIQEKMSLLRQQLAEKQLAEIRRDKPSAEPGSADAKKMRELEAMLAKFEVARTEKGPGEPVSADAKRARELEAMLERSASVAGRTLSAIRIEGLSDQLRNDLQGRIPVHVGETLSKESIERIAQAVRQFDEHLQVRHRFTGEGQSEIIITAPGR